MTLVKQIFKVGDPYTISTCFGRVKGVVTKIEDPDKSMYGEYTYYGQGDDGIPDVFTDSMVAA